MSLVKYTNKSLAKTGSVSGTAGKTMVGAGAGALGLSVLAGLIPFVGVVGLSVIFIIIGILMWE